jgi:hypothetical protein
MVSQPDAPAIIEAQLLSRLADRYREKRVSEQASESGLGYNG